MDHRRSPYSVLGVPLHQMGLRQSQRVQGLEGANGERAWVANAALFPPAGRTQLHLASERVYNRPNGKFCCPSHSEQRLERGDLPTEETEQQPNGGRTIPLLRVANDPKVDSLTI